MSAFQSPHDYEEFIYALKQRYPSVKRSTLIVVRRGKRTAVLQGEITFAKGYRITLKERLSFDSDQVVIESYSYELFCHENIKAWYDSQPIRKIRTLLALIRITSIFHRTLNTIVFLHQIYISINRIYPFLFRKLRHC